MSNSELPIDFLKGKLVCSIEDAMRAVDARRTKLYELIGAGEIETYLDGSRRKVVVASLIAYVQKRLDAARAERRAA